MGYGLLMAYEGANFVKPASAMAPFVSLCRARPIPRLTHVEVFETPPFWFTIGITIAITEPPLGGQADFDKKRPNLYK